MQLLIDLQYFPSIILYKNLSKASNIVFEQYEFYQKMSFRNRCQIAGAGGVVNLSIPLLHGRDQKTLIKDVRISDRQPWQAQHWKTIVSCYSRSPWFEYYRDELELLYKRRFEFLLDWNLTCFAWSLKTLPIAIPVTLTDGYEKTTEAGKKTDWRGKIIPKYQAVSHGQFSSPVQGPVLKYRQVFEERDRVYPGSLRVGFAILRREASHQICTMTLKWPIFSSFFCQRVNFSRYCCCKIICCCCN